MDFSDVVAFAAPGNQGAKPISLVQSLAQVVRDDRVVHGDLLLGFSNLLGV